MSDESNLTNVEIEKFEALFECAMKGLDDLIFLDGNPNKALTLEEEALLESKAELLKTALMIDYRNISVIFFLGKIYQRLGDFQSALFYLDEIATETDNPNISMEASIVAMSLGEIKKALQYSQHSVQMAPNFMGAMSNHAVNLMVVGDDQLALAFIDRALELEPKDPICQTVKTMIIEIMAGERERPRFDELV